MYYRSTLGLGLLLITCGWANAQTESNTRSSAAPTFYKWVDDAGVTHFSDSPRPGSNDPSRDAFELRQPNVSQAPRVRPRTSSRTNASATPNRAPGPVDAAPVPYTGIKIIAPANGDTLWNTGGNLNVGVQVAPGLNAGDGVVIMIDGKQMTPQPIRSTSISLQGVYRGEHVMTASVRSTDGTVQVTSVPVRFVVQQNTVN
ncbi:MAG: DUF4124 domain-containing protein [Gammaproteobacteria bacterium]